MNDRSDGPVSPDLLPALTEASTDLIQIGILSSTAERFALDRASAGRSAFEEELALERRVDDSRMSILAALLLARATAQQQPSLVNSGIATMLLDPLLASDVRERFDTLIGARDGAYADRMLELCDQIDSRLRAETSDGSEFPPVSGGDVTGCDLIALGSMLGGATCVVGCGPCCVVGAGGALLYVGACT